MSQFILYVHRNTASDNMVRCERKLSTRKGGVKESRISSICTLNFETKSYIYCLIELE